MAGDLFRFPWAVAIHFHKMLLGLVDADPDSLRAGESQARGKHPPKVQSMGTNGMKSSSSGTRPTYITAQMFTACPPTIKGNSWLERIWENADEPMLDILLMPNHPSTVLGRPDGCIAFLHLPRSHQAERHQRGIMRATSNLPLMEPLNILTRLQPHGHGRRRSLRVPPKLFLKLALDGDEIHEFKLPRWRPFAIADYRTSSPLDR